MHCLEVIIARNAKAAGREAAHAFNDKRSPGDGNLQSEATHIEAAAWAEGFIRGEQEG